MSEIVHQPVMLNEVLRYLDPRPGEVFVDATVGGGGHALALLERLRPGGYLLGVDRDREALEIASARLKPFAPNFKLFHASFGDLLSILEGEGISGVDGLLFDLGVSSYQLLRPERGFTYQQDAPLDMRMDRRQELTAETIVNTWPEEELARILREYGEERWASRIARFIVEERKHRSISTTQHLVEIVKAAIPARYRRRGPHPARRTFQALRIAVNGELDELARALASMDRILRPGGRVVVISFHSLEDRIVKHAFREMKGKCLEILTPKPVTPSREELASNPRARSAKLRAAKRVLKERVGE